MHEGNLNMITNSPETNYTTVTAEVRWGKNVMLADGWVDLPTKTVRQTDIDRYR